MPFGMIMSVLRDSYTVRLADGMAVSCCARGKFRKGGAEESLSPVTGDRVEVKDGCIVRVLERTSFLSRPPVANFDRIAIVCAAAEPVPSTAVIDKLIAIAELMRIEPILIFNKTDLATVENLRSIYAGAGFEVINVVAVTGEGIGNLKRVLDGHFTVFIGNSGVGKSSLLNTLVPSLSLKTDDISRKLGRGKHTTRTCEIIIPELGFAQDTLIADTPGFAAVDVSNYITVYSNELQDAYREFAPYTTKCKFYPSCMHVGEQGCAVSAAADEGRIGMSRLNSYRELYDAVKDNRRWMEKSIKPRTKR